LRIPLEASMTVDAIETYRRRAMSARELAAISQGDDARHALLSVAERYEKAVALMQEGQLPDASLVDF
jgi:hypothetical protein